MGCRYSTLELMHDGERYEASCQVWVTEDGLGPLGAVVYDVFRKTDKGRKDLPAKLSKSRRAALFASAAREAFSKWVL